MSNRFLAYTRTYIGPQGTYISVDDDTTRAVSVYQYTLFRNEDKSKDRAGFTNGEPPRVYVRIKHVKISFSTEYGVYKKNRNQTLVFPTKYSLVCYCSKQDITKNSIYWNDIYTLPSNVCYIRPVELGRYYMDIYEPNQQNPTYIYAIFHPDTLRLDFDTDVVLNPGEEFVFNLKITTDFPTPTQSQFNQIFVKGNSEHGLDYEIRFN